MKILVSSCLYGKNCKYNGGNNYRAEIKELEKEFELFCVCPEQLGGLPTPRIPSENINGMVINQEGTDVTVEFMLGAKKTLEIAQQEEIKIAILKKRSPSCGFGKVYDGTFTGTIVAGNGVTAELLFKNGIVILNEENYKDYLKRR